MNIALLGATEKFGSAFTAKLLSNPNYQLTLISKNAESIFEDSHRVTAKSMNEANLNQLKKALKDIDFVFCAVSGTDLPAIASNIVHINPKRLVFMTAVGIYDELEDGCGAEFNLSNEPQQIPNFQASEIIEKSDLDYTIFRTGFFEHGDDDDCIITKKGENVKGYFTTIESVEKIALQIIENPKLYSRENISITKDMSS